MASTLIDIRRPVGLVRAFERPVVLAGVRLRLLFQPSARPGGGWYLTIFNAVGDVVVRSLRLTPSSDLWGFARALKSSELPPGRLRLVAPAAPQLHDLASEAVQLYYDD